MTKFDLVISNGLVINANYTGMQNIGINNGRIACLSQDVLEGKIVYDAQDKWVIPGVVDTHVHFALKQGQGDDAVQTEDDYESGPIASAVGGVTTYVDYAICPQKRKLKPFIEERIAMADESSCIDFSFHCGITNSSSKTVDEIPGIVDMGIPSFKFFVTYRKWGFAVDLGFLWEVFNILRKLNGVACIHCEQDEIIEFLRGKHEDEDDFSLFGATRPDFSEEISVSELAILAREAKSRLHIVHLTTEKALDVIRRGQSEGVRIRTETCPHYLFLNEQIYKKRDGYLYTMTPPLRKKTDNEALWQGLRDGSIGIMASDHNALGRRIKEKFPHWSEVPPGLGGSEMLLTFLHSEGVEKGRITPNRMVDLLCTAPANEFGLPNKGRIEIGADADIVIFDPKKEEIVKHENLATPGGFSIFEGENFKGWPVATFSKGNQIVADGKFIGKIGTGKFIPRRIDPAVW